METKTPQRDIKVRIDNGPEITTPWNGEFEVPDSFKRIDFSHPKFQRRYVLHNEVRSDTIYLIPILHAIDEVVIYGKDRRKDLMANIMRPTIPKEPELPQVVPAGPDVIALLMWTWDHTFGPKVEARHKRKQALKKVRAQEQGGQAGGMSICIGEYAADPRLILGFHVVPGRWLLQGGTTGGG